MNYYDTVPEFRASIRLKSKGVGVYSIKGVLGFAGVTSISNLAIFEYKKGSLTAKPTMSKVTNAIGGSSYHNYGLAVDFALLMPDGKAATLETFLELTKILKINVVYISISLLEEEDLNFEKLN